MQPPPSVAHTPDPDPGQLALLDRLFRCTVDLCRVRRGLPGAEGGLDRVIAELDGLIREVRSGELVVSAASDAPPGADGPGPDPRRRG